MKLHIKTLKITPTCFDLLDHPHGVTFFLVKFVLKHSHLICFCNQDVVAAYHVV